jgi:hypothetical protein
LVPTIRQCDGITRDIKFFWLYSQWLIFIYNSGKIHMSVCICNSEPRIMWLNLIKYAFSFSEDNSSVLFNLNTFYFFFNWWDFLEDFSSLRFVELVACEINETIIDNQLHKRK